MKVVLGKFNLRQILVHGIAIWLLIKAFSLIAYLLYPDVVAAYVANKNMDEVAMDQLIDFNWALAYCEMAGCFTAFLISLIISLRKQWFWGNSVLLMIGMLLLFRLQIPVWDYAKVVFLAPGRLAEGIVIPFVINAIFLLLITFFLFFWSGIIRFINKSAYKKSISPAL